MQPLYIVTSKYGPWDGEKWTQYVKWSGLTQLKELVSLDAMLCAPALSTTKDKYWPYIVNEDFMLDYFTDLSFLLSEVSNTDDKNVLCVFKNPISHPQPPSELLQFEFLGYDLVDEEGTASALSNCGGFRSAFSNKELNEFGLLNSLKRSSMIQASLKELYPQEPHANCHLWAIFRAPSS